MGIHHIAIATRRLRETHDFYTQAMGFTLEKVVRARAAEGGWSKHAFYDTGDGSFFAVWDLHLDELPADWSPAISAGLGLPTWANHIAFRAGDADELAGKLDRLLAYGLTVMEVDHGFCRSIYVRDPNGIMVEFCLDQRPFTEAERREALTSLFDDTPRTDDDVEAITHHPAELKAGSAR